MKGGSIELSGKYSRLAPRYPIRFDCSLVKIIERRRKLRRSEEEVLIAAEVFELSINGAGIVLRITQENRELVDLAIGARLTLRVQDLDGAVAVRHIHVNRTEMRFGVEFLNVSDDFREFVNGILAQRRAGGRSLEARWESSH